ncbi:MAG: ABC transporter permease, partial [Pseudomonas amygdali]
LPDATTLILEGLLFTNLLLWEALGGRIAAWKIRLTTSPASLDKGALQHG